MILMVVLLLVMNCVLATGLALLWLRSRSWCEGAMDLEERLNSRIQGLEVRMEEMDSSKCDQIGFSPDCSPAAISRRLETREVTQEIPERYRLAVCMAENGMDLQQISETIGISHFEAEQLMNLARLSRKELHED